jgi:hypothetical protein
MLSVTPGGLSKHNQKGTTTPQYKDLAQVAITTRSAESPFTGPALQTWSELLLLSSSTESTQLAETSTHHQLLAPIMGLRVPWHCMQTFLPKSVVRAILIPRCCHANELLFHRSTSKYCQAIAVGETYLCSMLISIICFDFILEFAERYFV